jgi:hypothetical protein
MLHRVRLVQVWQKTMLTDAIDLQATFLGFRKPDRVRGLNPGQASAPPG